MEIKHLGVPPRPMRRLAPLIVGVAAIVCALASARPPPQEPFYKGKRLTIMINFAPGGPTDIEGRLLARHIAKHIDGQPLIIVQNMDGAGGLIGTNYLGEVAPKDGSVVGFLTAPAWRSVVDPEVYQRRFQDLRVHRLPAEQRRLLCALRSAARHEDRRRHHEGAGPGRRRSRRSTRRRTC